MNIPIPGECRFCGVTEDKIDGDKLCWLGPSRTVCNKPGCVRAHYADRDRMAVLARKANRKRTPAEIHAIKLQEARDRRKRNRKGRVA